MAKNEAKLVYLHLLSAQKALNPQCVPGLRFKFFTNAANNNKEHIMGLDRLRLSGPDGL